MQRRVALKNMAAALGGLVSLPAWASGWNETSLAAIPSAFSPGQDALLAQIVETIIPATDTPGAKELGVHRFVQKMVADCYDQKTQETFAKGLETVELTAKNKYSKAFAACDNTQRMELLGQMEQSGETSQKEFFSLVKGLTIRGYLNSEYVMTNLTHFELIPGRYYGCVPVAAK